MYLDSKLRFAILWLYSSEALSIAKAALKEEEDVKRRVQDVLRNEQINVNDEVSCTKEGVKNQILRMQHREHRINSLKEITAIELEEAGAEKDKWDNQRQHGHRKGAASLQRFLNNLSGFLEAYSGVVEVVRCAGAQYGDAGYGALSLLLIVGVYKTKNDEKIADALAELKESFPRLNLMTEVYPEERVELLVAETYKEVISFAREAADYFGLSSGRRLLTAIAKPPRLGVDIATERIHKRLAQVNAETSSLLHRNVKNIEQEMKNIQEQNKKLQQTLRNMQEEAVRKQAQDDQRRLDEFRGILGVFQEGEECQHTNIQACKMLLGEAFSPPPPSSSFFQSNRLSGYTQMTAEVLSTEQAYQSWKQCPGSSFLLLSGKSPSEAQVGNTTYCWLSYAAILAVEQLRNEGKRVAYYCCHPQARATEVPIQTAISHLLAQLLSWQPEILQDKLHHFQTLVQKDRWHHENEKKALEAIFETLKELLKHLKLEEYPTYIIIDRADQCKCRHRYLIEWFSRLACESASGVKIMVVMDSKFWNTDTFSCEDVREDSKGFMLCKLDWDQRRHF
ncbi:MAG: hypothetical protein M1834_000917 [Cirrosporium novae-zelandiae]|nr:MAG: hypothetical protein M1834_000917 [Cirrosporium novae-zelandiae]